uniref:Uncharacterized protein n=1 Tax=Arundo donax TaxID=35708 RepID=A0A0A9FRP3_ARUDO
MNRNCIKFSPQTYQMAPPMA